MRIVGKTGGRGPARRELRIVNDRPRTELNLGRTNLALLVLSHPRVSHAAGAPVTAQELFPEDLTGCFAVGETASTPVRLTA
ncbi:hypothetical protein GRJ2_001792000 [Grus japonensis]|uniref:Uncharacterized protein n=1 Tax=Grus japonensis TaxID=30415 RepID=A0ABC9X8C7_GRUJA